MKNNTEEELKKEDLISELMGLAFKKATKDSKDSTAYAISRYLNSEINNEINERTLTRYYDGYFLNKEKERTTPNDYNLNVLSNYLGYKNFKDFEVRRIYEKTINTLKYRCEESITILKNRITRMQRIGLSCILILLLLAVSFISKYYKKNCMIWVEDHYEKIKCSGSSMEDSLDIVRLKKFKKVKVCKDSLFFKNNKPIKHYLRHNNKIEFFTYSGKHPIYENKFVNEVTHTIYNNHVNSCDSVLK